MSGRELCSSPSLWACGWNLTDGKKNILTATCKCYEKTEEKNFKKKLNDGLEQEGNGMSITTNYTKALPKRKAESNLEHRARW